MLNFALQLKLNILEYMRIINDGSTLILLDEDSGKFYKINKVPCLIPKSFNYYKNTNEVITNDTTRNEIT